MTRVHFNFTFMRHHISLFPSTLCPLSEPFTANNDSLDYLRGSLGHSYMCHEEQTLDVAQDLSINTYQLQVQPFGLTDNQFGAGKLSLHRPKDFLIVKSNVEQKMLLSCSNLSFSLSRGVPVGWRRHVDPHHSWSSFSWACPHRACGLSHRQE